MIKSIPSCKPNQMMRRDQSGNNICCYTLICRQGEYGFSNTHMHTDVTIFLAH